MTTGIPREYDLTPEEYYISMGVMPHPVTHTVVIRNPDGDAFLTCISLQEAQQVHRSFINYGKYQSVTIQEGKVIA